jgi:hypothetical protein
MAVLTPRIIDKLAGAELKVVAEAPALKVVVVKVLKKFCIS